MSPRTLFIVILRVLGILMLKELLTAIPQFVSATVMFFNESGPSGGLFMIFVALLAVAVYLLISYVLIFKADFLVTKFGLQQDIKEESLQLNISIPSILRIAIIITGCLVLFLEIPELVRTLYWMFQKQDIDYFQGSPTDWSPIIVSVVKIIIALLIIGERKRILEFLEKSPAQEAKDQDNQTDQNPA